MKTKKKHKHKFTKVVTIDGVIKMCKCGGYKA